MQFSRHSLKSQQTNVIIRTLVLILFCVFACSVSSAGEAPKFVEKGGRWALLVDGQPYLILGGQVHNSSAWPSELPAVWKSLAELHANTVEAPAYWEQVEPQEGKFNWENVDAIVKGAREHNLHVVILWFGTWKNGNMHYVPDWVKTDTKRFPRVIRADGEPIDVLSASSHSNLEADKKAFVALMQHLKSFDATEHTVLMVQVENESGIIGSPRDFSAESNKEFAGQVPADMLSAAHKQPGTWSEVFRGDADELFQLFHQAHYLNEIAAAGKAEFDIPLYMNVWLSYPPAELPERALPKPGIGYPSGGAVQRWVGLWRALAPSIQAIAPDIYGDDAGFVSDVLAAYHRPDNPLLVPEIAKTDSFARYDFLALGDGALGIAPFGVDPRGWNILGDSAPAGHARNFALLAPMNREIARLNFEGKLKTSMEEAGKSQQELDFGPWQATVSYGYPQNDGRRPPGTSDAHGVALIAQLGLDEFLVTGVDASVSFHLPGRLPGMRMQVLSAEEGSYQNGVWKSVRLWNGDETDRGLQFHANEPVVIRIRLGKF
jgi:beta-galactosidase GanA